MNPRRSGHDVKDTVRTAGLVSSLLAPFIHLAVVQLELLTGPLGPGYEAQLLAATVAAISWGAAEWRMRRRQASDDVPA